MPTVTLQGVTYDSADLADGGHRNPDVGFFAILEAMVAELAAAALVQSISPGAAGNILQSNGTDWIAALLEYGDISDASAVLNAVQAVAALGSPLQLLRVNAAGTGLEFGSAEVTFQGTRAYKSASQTLTTGVLTKIAIDAESYDVGGRYDTATRKYVVPAGEDGVHDVILQLGFNTNSTGRRKVHLYKNGASIAVRTTGNAGGSDDTHVVLVDSPNLVAGDELEMYGLHDAGTDVGVRNSAAETFMIVNRRGAAA